jgi:protein TonB
MTTRRETSPSNDAVPRIVSHRLQQTGGQSVVNGSRNASHANGARPNGQNTGARPIATANGSTHSASTLRQVVLVDRDIDALRDIAIALREEYDFHITISGNEALALLHDGSVDTIVVGQNLYSSTGINVLSAARRSAPGTRRVLLASAVEASGIERESAGAAPFQLMHRPCTPDKLRDLLEQSLEPQSPPVLSVAVQPKAPPRESPKTEARAPAAPEQRAPVAKPAQTSSPLRHDIDPNDYEHVVLETAPELPRRQARTAAVPDDAHLPVTVYTDNAEFYQGICAALQDRHDVRLATQIDRVIEFAEMGQCPILVTDRAGTQVELQRISIAVRTIEPALVTIASGPLQDGNIFRKLIGTGALHSFLPKPLSPQLVRLAIEGARRQHWHLKHPQVQEIELAATPTSSPFKSPRPRPQTTTAPSPAKPPPAPIYMPMDLRVDDYSGFEWRKIVPFAGIAAVAILIAVGGWYGWQAWNRIDPIEVAIKQDIQLAQEAFDAGNLVMPADSSAAHYYREVLKRDDNHAIAQQGLNLIAETLVEQTERALLDEDLDKATQTLAALSALDPTHKRLAYLDAQLSKVRGYREQAANSAQSRRAAVPNANKNSATDASAYAPISNEAQRQQAITRWLSTARQRMAQGQLVRPENDSAEFYLRQVERADPDNVAVQQLLRDIGSRLLIDAQEALSRQQLDNARRRVAEATRLGGDTATIARLQREIESAANVTSRTQYLRLALQRARENQLLEPDRDSAKYYLNQLQRMDSTSTETEQALRAVGLRLVDSANQATSQQQFNTAIRLLNEARQLGFAGPELAAAENKLRTARTPVAVPSNVKPLSAAPKAIKTVAPKFPENAAKAGISAWVDVNFRITASGDVADATTVGSSPAGSYTSQFERAALSAIRQYKFEARDINDAETTQRMTVRMQFQLQ